MWERLARFERHYPGVLWNAQRWPTRDGYMPFRLFRVYEAEIATHEAYSRISAMHAHRFATGAARTEHGDYTDEFREDMKAARLLPRRSA